MVLLTDPVSAGLPCADCGSVDLEKSAGSSLGPATHLFRNSVDCRAPARVSGFMAAGVFGGAKRPVACLEDPWDVFSPFRPWRSERGLRTRRVTRLRPRGLRPAPPAPPARHRPAGRPMRPKLTIGKRRHLGQFRERVDRVRDGVCVDEVLLEPRARTAVSIFSMRRTGGLLDLLARACGCTGAMRAPWPARVAPRLVTLSRGASGIMPSTMACFRADMRAEGAGQHHAVDALGAALVHQ